MPSGQKQQQLPGPVPHQHQGPTVSWGGASLERKPVSCYMVHRVCGEVLVRNVIVDFTAVSICEGGHMCSLISPISLVTCFYTKSE